MSDHIKDIWSKISGNNRVRLSSSSHSSNQEQSEQFLSNNIETADESLILPNSNEGYTTKTEIFGWCLYSWAAEPFIVSAVSTYVPLLLEQFARENGVRLDNHLIPCLSSSPIVPPILPPPGNGTSPGLGDPVSKLFTRDHDGSSGATTTEEQVKCVVYVLGGYIDTSSFALYTFSFSVFIQTLVVISMSGAADRGHYRKQLLITFGFVGALATISYIYITSSRYYIASFLAIVANSCFGAVNVCGNSFLPILVANHKDVEQFETNEADNDHPPNDTISANKDDTLVKGNLITKISGMGAASGYISALIVQILSMFIVIKTGSKTKSIQYAIFFVGIWWLFFQIPLIFLLKSRPGPQLIINKDQNILIQYIKYGWKTLFISIKHASQLKDVAIYLLGWFIVSDSVTTMNSAAILFARSELQMSTPKLVIVGILSVIFAIGGSIIVPQLQSRFQVTPKISLIYIIIWASLIPLYGIMGFYFKLIGLKHDFEMYLLAIWYGFALGGLATISRSLFSLLIPKGKESTFFSLFSVTDKGSSIIGPTITALITDRTHNIRYTFYFLFLLLVLAIPVYSLLDVERGKNEARTLEHVDDEGLSGLSQE
ncbi:Autophagy-related protein [Wickerhamomyces ciferrii]|uniref:Autophagy-related protein n=1 Tax=Wickerhamomyces ciferrii (strain ATCC 14091 / BCRC 22168 / CBS 111 / JCM 3599 / NBRC 0793 / NRRL Y-1031 F-60-10) TaxID=1206466 RepID=K0KMF6_WICCF|nr:Autophagy-related protein [Wickerhamomyces ciferrii]CCH46460.1 Autophagy-related protein [Wickerhamomyces ciferrii]